MEVTTAVATPALYDQYPRTFTVTICCVLVVQMTFGLACNLIVLVVYHLHKRPQRGATGAAGISTPSANAQSISSELIANLNVMDVIVNVAAIPLTLALVLTGPSHSLVFCLWHEAAVSFVTCASALNLLIISVHRHHSILKPFSKHHFKRANLKWILLILWSLSLLGLCGPFLILIGNRNEVAAKNKLVNSCLQWAETFGRRVFFEIYYILLYFVANIVIIVCYVKIFRQAKFQLYSRATGVLPAQTAQSKTNALTSSQKNNEKTVTKMTLMIVLTFMICWAPQALISIITLVKSASKQLEMAQITCVTLAYTATVLHPLLYAFIRKNFRDEIRNICRRPTRQILPQMEQPPPQVKSNPISQPIFHLQKMTNHMAAHVKAQITSSVTDTSQNANDGVMGCNSPVASTSPQVIVNAEVSRGSLNEFDLSPSEHLYLKEKSDLSKSVDIPLVEDEV